MGDELTALRAKLREHRQHLREVTRRCRVAQFQTFNYQAMTETRRALSEQLMVEQTMHEGDRQERARLAASRIEKLEQEIAQLDTEVKEASARPPMPVTREEEVDSARAHADQLAGAIAKVRAELEAEIVREQQEVQKILGQLQVEQVALEEAQSACTALEDSLVAAKPPPLPPQRATPPPPPKES